MYLLSHPSVEVVAVTLPGAGEAGCDLGVEVTIRLLSMFQQPEIPVACDPEIPVGAHEWPDEFLSGQENLTSSLPFTPREPTSESPSDLIARVAAEPGPPLVIYAVAPLTNIAAAIRNHPDVAKAIDQLVVMGGAVDTQGNVEGQNAEWNIWVDVASAATVLRSGVPITLVPLDATNDVPVPKEYLDTLEASEQTASIIYLSKLAATFPAVTSGFYYMWDELAAAVAAGELTVSLEQTNIMIAESGADTGRTVRNESGSGVSVATGVPDPAAFYDEFIRRLATPLKAAANSN